MTAETLAQYVVFGVKLITITPSASFLVEADDMSVPVKSLVVDISAVYIVLSGLGGSSEVVQVTVTELRHILTQAVPVGFVPSVAFHSGESVVVERTPAQFSAITLPQYVVFANSAVVFVEPNTPQKVSLETMAVPSAKFVDDN